MLLQVLLNRLLSFGMALATDLVLPSGSRRAPWSGPSLGSPPRFSRTPGCPGRGPPRGLRRRSALNSRGGPGSRPGSNGGTWRRPTGGLVVRRDARLVLRRVACPAVRSGWVEGLGPVPEPAGGGVRGLRAEQTAGGRGAGGPTGLRWARTRSGRPPWTHRVGPRSGRGRSGSSCSPEASGRATSSEAGGARGGPPTPTSPESSGPWTPPPRPPLPAPRRRRSSSRARAPRRSNRSAAPWEEVAPPEVPTGTGVVTGTVKTTDGAPLPGVEITLVPPEKEDRRARLGVAGRRQGPRPPVGGEGLRGPLPPDRGLAADDDDRRGRGVPGRGPRGPRVRRLGHAGGLADPLRRVLPRETGREGGLPRAGGVAGRVRRDAPGRDRARGGESRGPAERPAGRTAILHVEARPADGPSRARDLGDHRVRRRERRAPDGGAGPGVGRGGRRAADGATRPRRPDGLAREGRVPEGGAARGGDGRVHRRRADPSGPRSRPGAPRGERPAAALLVARRGERCPGGHVPRPPAGALSRRSVAGLGQRADDHEGGGRRDRRRRT